jgi:hypothetical protein
MKDKIDVIGGRIEFNGFRVANLVASLPASIKSDFTTYIETIARRAYDEGRKNGYDEGRSEAEPSEDTMTMRLR